MKVIHLQTSKVAGNGNDGYSKIERKTVKLEDGKVFNDFIKRFKLNGYSTKGTDYPKVIKVINTFPKITKKLDHLNQVNENYETVTEELEEVEAYQKLVDIALKPVVIEKVESEDVKSLKKQNEDLMKRLSDIEAKLSDGVDVVDIVNGLPETIVSNDNDEKAPIIAEIIDRGGRADKRMGVDKLTSILEELKNK